MVTTPIETNSSLKAICPRKDLFSAVQAVAHAVSGRSPLPILSHILIRSEEGGLRLVATDLELGISCRVAATVQEPGALTAPARTLAEVLGNLPDKSDVALSVDRSHTVRLHCERSDYKILGLPAEEYPQLPEVADAVSFTVPQAVLKEMIRKTIFAVSSDEGRAILTGILMVVEENALHLVSTDTHRLALCTVALNNVRGTQNAVVPSRTMNELLRLLTDSEGDVNVTISSNQVRFLLPGEDDVQIVSRLIEGQFPPYQRVIPTEYRRRLSIPTQPFLQAVKRASIVARDSASAHRIILRTDEDKLVLTAENQIVGSAYEELEVLREGDDVEVAFNARYLLDVLSVIEEEGVTLDLTEPLKPGVIRPIAQVEEEENSGFDLDYLCVLMPMQIV
ncbi:DNA polymerase III, beta subunit [Chthonomonas calidirosea]|uniref:Beta sliding clamp n=1 Tax=Chthonomonas calidirosea (strain DSM 23976 / ICMP 18418 / T49) TaxID=1303518 RepID=S0EWD9_CHTCT|nr:DNA polymerase III subunit beta [Chthonomonas calidirosea]CCW36199.1 DNA polymerase III, beta subunit [Chthonomonas calidirosea T49]CEK18047.1 DNA polymerase III, beta subunit [Chthonomonas calidirosea]